MICKYNNREIVYSTIGDESKNDFTENKLDLAYAMTVHKAQGKGYDTVVIIIHSSMYSGLLNRNLLYTAITRAKKKCIIIGDDGGLEECKKLMEPRITSLFKNSINTKMDLLDTLILVDNNINKCLKSTQICELLKTFGVEINNLKNELSKLHTVLLKNINLLNELVSFIKGKNFDESNKCIQNNRSNILD